MGTDSVDLKVRRSGRGQDMTAFAIGSVIHLSFYSILAMWPSQVPNSALPFAGSTVKEGVSYVSYAGPTSWPSEPYL